MQSQETIADLYYDVVESYSPRLDTVPGFGNWHLKVIHYCVDFPEIVWDISYCRGISYITTTRFLKSVRKTLLADNAAGKDFSGVPIEISRGELPVNDHTSLEVNLGIISGCQHDPGRMEDGDQYKLIFTEATGQYQAMISDPYVRKDCECWQRLVNRLIGSGLKVPRRFVAA